MEGLENFKDLDLSKAPRDSTGNKLIKIEEKAKEYPRFKKAFKEQNDELDVFTTALEKAEASKDKHAIEIAEDNLVFGMRCLRGLHACFVAHLIETNEWNKALYKELEDGVEEEALKIAFTDPLEEWKKLLNQ